MKMRKSILLLLGAGILQPLYGAVPVSINQYNAWLNQLRRRLNQERTNKQDLQELFHLLVQIEGAHEYDTLNNVQDAGWKILNEGFFNDPERRKNNFVVYKYEDILKKLDSIKKEKKMHGPERRNESDTSKTKDQFFESDEFVSEFKAFEALVKEEFKLDHFEKAAEGFMKYKYSIVPSEYRKAYRDLGESIVSALKKKDYMLYTEQINEIRAQILKTLNNTSEYYEH